MHSCLRILTLLTQSHSYKNYSVLAAYASYFIFFAVNTVLLFLYGNPQHALAFSAISLCALVGFKVADRLGRKKMAFYGFFVNTVIWMGLPLIMETGSVLVIMYVWMAITVFTATKCRLLPGTQFAVLFCTPFLYDYFDFSLLDPPTMPLRVWYGANVMLIMFIVWQIAAQLGRRTLDRVTFLTEAEANARVQENAIQQKLEALSKTNVDLTRMSKRLSQKAIEEAELTQELRLKIYDQVSLVQAIHHDLREPLRNIVSFTQLISRKLSRLPEAEGAQDYLKFAVDGGNRMSVMLEDLLRYTQHREEAMVEVDLNELIQSLHVDLSDTLSRNNGELVAGKLPTILGYPTQVRQLFQNLIANALKFARPAVPPRIQVNYERNKKGSVVVIRDNGIGIPEHRLDEVFGLFNRVHRRGEYEGSGVGLALCRRIAIAHGADIRVESVVGEGSVFFVDGFEIAHSVKHSQSKEIDLTTVDLKDEAVYEH